MTSSESPKVSSSPESFVEIKHYASKKALQFGKRHLIGLMVGTALGVCATLYLFFTETTVQRTFAATFVPTLNQLNYELSVGKKEIDWLTQALAEAQQSARAQSVEGDAKTARLQADLAKAKAELQGLDNELQKARFYLIERVKEFDLYKADNEKLVAKLQEQLIQKQAAHTAESEYKVARLQTDLARSKDELQAISNELKRAKLALTERIRQSDLYKADSEKMIGKLEAELAQKKSEFLINKEQTNKSLAELRATMLAKEKEWKRLSTSQKEVADGDIAYLEDQIAGLAKRCGVKVPERLYTLPKAD